MASNSTLVYPVSPIMGVDLDAKSSTPAFKPLTGVRAIDGKLHLYAKASEALASTDNIKIGTAGSASSDSGSAGFTCNTTGGVATGQYFWARQTAF
jgi:uncharacterized iron-regulated membrane protein